MSTFAPPTGPPVTALPDHPAPRRRRGPLLIVAVVALVAAGIGAILALSAGGTDDGEALPEAEAFSLAAAAEQAVDASTVRFDMTVTAGSLGAVTVDGVVDNDNGVSRLTMDLGSLMGLGGVAGTGGEIGAMEVLFDSGAGVVYFGAEAMGGLLPTDAPWVSFDLEALAEASGQSLEDLQGEFSVDPADTAAALLAADDVTVVGDEVIDGVPTRHYRVTVDLAAALAAVPQADADQLGSAEFGELDLPDAVVYDVWVTEDNQLRRSTFEMDVAGETTSVVLNMFADAEPAAIELPSGDDVVDLTEFLGF